MATWLLVLVFAGLTALGYMGYLNPIKAELDSAAFTIEFGDYKISAYKAIKAVLAIIILLWVASIISGVGEKYIKKLRKVRSSNRALLTKILQIVIYFVAFLIGMDVLGIDLTALAIFSGAVGIGVGFGLQKIASNFISGLILLFEKSIEEGDLVELDGGIYGFIRNTGMRATLIETFDGKEIMIPNEDFITSRVINWTYSNSKGRAEINIGVAYDSDIEKAHELILDAAKEHPRCSKDNPPDCFLREFGDSSVNFLLFFWVDDVIEGRLSPINDILFSVWKKFKKNGIEIPFPQRDLHIKEPIIIKKGK